MSKTHESNNQLNKNILVITKNIYSVIYEHLDHDRLQLFISLILSLEVEWFEEVPAPSLENFAYCNIKICKSIVV